MSASIEVRNLNRRFGSFVAVDNITCSVAEGKILAFSGPSRTGKTTTIKMLTTLIPGLLVDLAVLGRLPPYCS